MCKRILAFFLSILLLTLVSNTVYAQEKTMPDGGVFDAIFYAANNPDVVAALGTDESVLYQHYLNYGKAEGRLPYASASIAPTTQNDTGAQVTNSEEIELAAWAYKMIVAREAKNLNSGNLAIRRMYVVNIEDKDCNNFYKIWGGHNCFKDSPHVCIDYSYINDNGASLWGTVMVGKSTIRSKSFDQVVASDGSYISYLYTTSGLNGTWGYTNVTLLDMNDVITKAGTISSSKVYTSSMSNHQGLYAGSLSSL